MPDIKRFGWNIAAKLYDRAMKVELDAYNKIAEYIKKDVKKDSDILEIAAGTGTISLMIATHANKIMLTDFSSEMLEVAKRKAKVLGITNFEFSVQNAFNLTLPERHYDAAIIMNVLHIVEKPEDILSGVKRLLKKDGVIIVPTFLWAQEQGRDKSKAKIKAKLRFFLALFSVVGVKIYNRWSAKSFQKFILSNGFDIIHADTLTSSAPIEYIAAKLKKDLS